MNYITAKTIISAYMKENTWFGNNYNMNIYKGCSHGCIYCDSRSECYQVENFDEVRAKENSINIIKKELKSKRRKGVIGTGSMSDPYNPCEKNFQLTRSALKLIDEYEFGVSIATKSDLIFRDIDILKKIKKHSPVLVKITITTSNDELCKKIEPNVSLTSKRFEVLNELSKNDIFCGVLLMPVLPFIEDSEENIFNIIKMAHENGVKFIYPSFGVTLRQNQRLWFFNKLDQIFPRLKNKYIRQFGNSYECYSPNAEKLWNLFQFECKKYGILYKMKEIIEAYKKGYENEQLSLF
jgi:DNA repair photolyase